MVKSFVRWKDDIQTISNLPCQPIISSFFFCSGSALETNCLQAILPHNFAKKKRYREPTNAKKTQRKRIFITKVDSIYHILFSLLLLFFPHRSTNLCLCSYSFSHPRCNIFFFSCLTTNRITLMRANAFVCVLQYIAVS